MHETYPHIAEMVDALDHHLREDFEERAAIIEHDAGHSRPHAECLALLDVLRRNPSALSGVSVLRVALDGGTEWLLTTDAELARRHLAGVGGDVIASCGLGEVVETQYGGFALLTTLG